MTERYRTLIVGLAGAVTVTVAQLAITALQAKLSIAAVVLVVAGVSLSTYIASFALIEHLYSTYVWQRYSRRNLSGSWDMRLTNLSDGSTRTGRAEIAQTPSALRVSCVNYRPGTEAAYSTWTSILADFADETTLFFVYQVESTADWKPFKRGIMRLQVAVREANVLTGDFFDNAPSDDRGPVTFTRVSDEQ
jgi:hypothetical protein